MFIVVAPIFSLNGVFAQSEPEFGFRLGGGVLDTVSVPVIFSRFTFQGTTIATI